MNVNSIVRIKTQRLDAVMNLIGELVVAELMVREAGQPVPVTCSFGVAEASLDGGGILARADQCLYQSKAAGRDRVTVDRNVTAMAS